MRMIENFVKGGIHKESLDKDRDRENRNKWTDDSLKEFLKKHNLSSESEARGEQKHELESIYRRHHHSMREHEENYPSKILKDYKSYKDEKGLSKSPKKDFKVIPKKENKK